MAPEVGELDTSFFGRMTDLRALTASLEQARAGRGRPVAVTGDAGIGKTRLVEELAHEAALPPGRILWGRCSEQAGAPSYWPWSRALRSYASSRGVDRLRADLGGEAPLLAPFIPALRIEPTASLATSERGDGESRYLLFDAVAALLRRIAAEEPLIVVLEDVHWADEASLALL